MIPTSRHSLGSLLEAWMEILAARDENLFVEITLIRDVNDQVEHALAMAELLGPLQARVRVNLLPMNEGRAGLWPSPPGRAVAYRDVMYQHRLRCIIRKARGADQGAACGQLAIATGAAL